MKYEIEFRNFNGSLVDCLAEIADWLIKHRPVNPKILVLEQSSNWVRINVICDDYHS